MRALVPVLLLAACGPGRPVAEYAVLFDPALRDVVLLREGAELLRIPPDGIQLGAVDALRDDLSYDPWFLDAADVRWLAWTGAIPGGGDAAVAATLLFEEGARADLEVEEVGEGRFAARLVPTDDGDAPPIAMIRLAVRVDAEEGFYGLGSALDTPNHRGHRRPMQLEADLSVETANNEAHVAVPLIVGTTGWGLFVEDPHPMVFEVATDADDLVEVTVGTGVDTAAGLDFHLYAAQHPLDVTRRYWDTTGDPELPAPWAYGPLVWRDENRDQAEVEDDLGTMRALDLPASGIWLDRPYASGVNTFDFDPGKYDDPDAMIALAHDLGFRVALWHVPYADPVEAPVQNAEAVAGGYFPPEAPPVFNDWSLPVDFTDPQARAWWEGWIRSYTDRGIEGFKLDYAQDIVLGVNGGRLRWAFSDGSDERTMHRLYVGLYHQVYLETLPPAGGFLLCRAGSYGGHTRAPVIWPGDLDATMAAHREPAIDRGGEAYVSVGGLPAALVDGLSLGPAGYPFYGSDTGGYRHCPPDKETFTRWFEQTALSTVMQIGTSCNDVAWEPTSGNGFDAEMLGWYRDYTRLHLRLFPYVWSYAARLAEPDGRPIQRALGLAYPELGWHPTDTYLVGDHLLVAPVVERGAVTRQVPFPPGAWVDWWTGEIFEGPARITVDAPLATLPLYVGAGGIVPLLRPTIDTLAPVADPEAVDSWAEDPGPLWFRTVPGPGRTLDLYDGGRFEQRRIGQRWIARWTPGDRHTAGPIVEAIATARPGSVVLDGTSLSEGPVPGDTPAWSWTEGTGGTLWIQLGADSREIVVGF